MLKTEMRNERSMNIDKMSAKDMMRIMQEENLNAVKAIESELNAIGEAVDKISERMEKGGRLFYVGCGTSGRLGVLDAAECPPTYGVSGDRVIGIIAGGDSTLRKASENAEDIYENGYADIKKYNLTVNDSVIGISVAGGASYVLGALAYAKEMNALTVALSCNEGCPIEENADISIHPDTGAEVITGSTRMKAGTAHKMILNMISTAVMVKLGYVYENLMINLKPSNIKLRDRMIRIVKDITGLSYDASEDLLKRNGFNIRDSINTFKNDEGKTTACILSENGTPKLYINGEKQEGLLYITYLTENNCYEDFAKAGYKLYSFTTYFGSNFLNENTKLEVFTRGIFDNEEPDFKVFDDEIEKILKACPDAYIMPRVIIKPPRSWEEVHPDELYDTQEDGTRGRASYASDLWAEWVKEKTVQLVEHIEKMPYASHIIGYQIGGGRSGEWLGRERKKGFTGKRALEKYEIYLKENNCESCEENYYRFYHELTAKRIAEFSRAFKDASKRQIIVGSFYGYIMETPSREEGHSALKLLLEGNDVDFFCSPISYKYTRAAGRDHPYVVPLESMRLHGKLYFSENDTRTHLSKPVESIPQIRGPIWCGPDFETSCNIIKMHAARALINGHAAWWFDMWGGWYKNETYMKLMKEIREIFEKSKDLPMGKTKEVAVFFDAESVPLITFSEERELLNSGDKKRSVWSAVCEMRETLGKMGAPYDIYISSDAEAVVSKYKMIISLVAKETPNTQKVYELAKKNNKAYFAITKENSDISTDELRTHMKKAGVHLWTEKDAVIYANENYVFLHAAEDGVCKLNVPDNHKLEEVFTKEKYSPEKVLKRCESYLYEIISS